MSDKSVFYVVAAIVLIFLFQSSERVLVEFIKSSQEPESGMFMIPMNPQMVPQSAPFGMGNNWAQK